MIKYIGIAFSIILTSFYFFPFEFLAFPGVNTKMAMAGLSLIILGFQLGMKANATIDKDFFNLSILALLVSFASFISMVYNNTEDPSFLTYFISMWVWLGGAYTLIQCLKFVHGYVSVRLCCNYLISVCVAQCFFAYAISVFPALDNFVDGFLGGEAFMGRAEGRMYGIGCALDVAGLRFSTVLVMIVFILVFDYKYIKPYIFLYLMSFIIITIIGNMMARSTTIGVGLSICFLLFVSIYFRYNGVYVGVLWKQIGGLMLVIVPVIVMLYYTNATFHSNLRFGFEGFFSLWEKGRWEVSSNDILFEHMIVFPETLKTWIIGDGYAANPKDDPYYIGKIWHGYYMGTDIGYLRFIFYFGIIGTLAFIVFICTAAWSCMKRFPAYRWMFLMILIVNLVGWFKVSSDVFLALAIFLCISKEEQKMSEDKGIILS